MKREFFRVLETVPERLGVLERCYNKVAEAVVKLPKDTKALQIVDEPTRFAFRVYTLFEGTVRVILEGPEEAGVIAGNYISGKDIIVETQDPQVLEEIQAQKLWEKFGNRTITASVYRDGLGRRILRFKTVPEGRKKNHDYLILI